MIKIAAIDDEEQILKYVAGLIRQEVGEREDIEVSSYSEPEVFLDLIEKGMDCDILFCDIEMKGINGIELGKSLKKKRPGLCLIFLTAHSEFAVESYSLDAYQYILKTQVEERLPVVLKNVIEKIEAGRKNYRILGGINDKRKVYFSDIIYFCKDKNAKYVRFVTVNGTIRERMTLEEARNKFSGSEFVLVERGCVVNIKHITRVKECTLFMSNQDQVCISKNRAPAVKERINTFWGIL